MAKEIPYFKFYTAEWSNGDITLEDYECQGIFINICAYYWSKDCDLTLSVLLKRFRGFEGKINELIASGIIKNIDGLISISFLNEQMQSKEIQKITNQKNGMKGGRPKKEETEKKPNGLFLETQTKANDNPNLTNIEKSIEEEKSIITQVVPTSAIDFDKFIKKFNSFANRNFRATNKVKTALKARLKEYSKEEIIEAIENAHNDSYHKENNFQYLTPEFILRPDKLEKFLNQPKQQQIGINLNLAAN